MRIEAHVGQYPAVATGTDSRPGPARTVGPARGVGGHHYDAPP
jgi:hypothetical protein